VGDCEKWKNLSRIHRLQTEGKFFFGIRMRTKAGNYILENCVDEFEEEEKQNSFQWFWDEAELIPFSTNYNWKECKEILGPYFLEKGINLSKESLAGFFHSTQITPLNAYLLWENSARRS